MRYPFRCTVCGLEFEVSRPAREAAAEASCPAEGASAERVFTVPSMNFGRRESTTPAPPSSSFSRHGHSHGPGTGHHSH
ncbi:MAG: FmdB family zinc ribbon protein [Candidatus Rokuibacteriota bacterium]